MQLDILTQRLVEIVSAHYVREFDGQPETPITPASTFADLDMDGLDFMELTKLIEEQLDVVVPVIPNFRDYSLEELASLLIAK